MPDTLQIDIAKAEGWVDIHEGQDGRLRGILSGTENPRYIPDYVGDAHVLVHMIKYLYTGGFRLGRTQDQGYYWFCIDGGWNLPKGEDLALCTARMYLGVLNG